MCVFGIWSTVVSGKTLTVDSQTRQVNLLPFVEIYKDPSGLLEIEDVLEPAIQALFSPPPAQDSELNFGFTNATYWIRLTLQSAPEAAENWILEVPYLSLSQLTLYTPEQPPIQVGTNLSANNKPIFYPLYAFPLTLKQVPQVFYLKVRSDYALTVPMTLWSTSEFSREFSDKLLSQALYFGGLLTLALYNFLLYLSLRDRSYLYYSLFAMTLGMGMFSGNGYGRLYLWPNAETWDLYAQTTFFSLAGALSAYFTCSFLRTRETTPRLHRWLQIFAAIYLVIAALLVLSNWQGFSVSLLFQAAFVIALPATLCAFAAGTICYKSGNRGALYFLLASGSFWMGVNIAALRVFDFIPSNSFTMYALQIGSCIEMLLFSFALANRIHNESEERILAQALAIEARNELLAMAKETETTLENRVIERTEKLQQIALNERDTRQQYVRFGAMIAHEFRNPLGIIETQSTLLQRENALGINKIEDRTEAIRGAAHRLATLFDQWLRSDQLQQPISKVHAEPIELYGFMIKIIRAARGYHHNRQIDMEPIPKAALNGDSALLEIALLNLIDNACKYSPENEPVGVAFRQRDAQIGIVVWDKGSGILPEHYDEVVKPYVRTGDTLSRPGFGLGLAFVAHIVELHQGEIEIASQLDKGSQFCIWLPLLGPQTDKS
jgi:signal transduction histidine kinase